MIQSSAAMRRAFAKEIATIAGVRHSSLVGAFAAVPREAFLGPGPWKIMTEGQDSYRETPDDDVVHVYENACIAIDPARGLNNGEPGLHMGLFDVLDPQAGEHIVQIGVGTGYYTAILAELVGSRGRVTAIEYDADLARRAADNLAAYPHVAVICADGSQFDSGPANGIYVCAGVTAPNLLWLDNLTSSGRLIVPMTTDSWEGQILRVQRKRGAFSARFIRPCGFIPCMGARDSRSEILLSEALERSGHESVRSLRRDTHDPDTSCWLHDDDYYLSRNSP